MADRGPVLIGVGNEYRRDDGVGPVVVAEVAARGRSGARLVTSDGEPTALLEAWADAPLAVVVDAVRCEPSRPGRVHRYETAGLPRERAAASSHALGVPDALRLGFAVDRVPRRLVVYAVEAADLGFGVALSAPVRAVVPRVVDAVLAELSPWSRGRPPR